MAFETLNSLVELVGRFQRMNKFSREHLIDLRAKFFQTIGLAVLTYCFVSLLLTLLTLIVSIVRSLTDPWLGEQSHFTLPLIFALFFLIRWFWKNSSSGRFACAIVLLLLIVGCVKLSTKKEKFSLARMPLEENPSIGRSSLYFAYTDVSCSSPWPADRSIPLSYYRFHAPFPIYVAVLKSGGPRCYDVDRRSFCATRKLTSSAVSRFFSPLVFLSLLLLVIGLLQWRRKGRRRLPFVDENLRRIFTNDFQVERMRCACLQALNHVLAETDDSLRIDSVQFANVHIRQLFHDKIGETPKKLSVDGLVEFDQLKFLLSQRSTGESWRIDVGKVLGTFRMKLLINDADYAVEMQFERLQMYSIEIIDQLTNVLLAPSTGEHPLIELLRATICQTIVPCSFQPTDAAPPAERIVSPVTNVPSPSPPPPPVKPDPLVDDPTPVLPPPAPPSPLPPPGQPTNSSKKFLVSLVKAVKLPDVEQPYCLLQLNEPKQTHQSSLAKNGVNPFWDERFLFDWNERSSELRLQMFDRTKSKKKKTNSTNDRLFAEISIPLSSSFLNETIEQKDLPINPRHPDSIVRLKFALLNDNDDDSAIEHDFSPSRTDDIVALPIHQQMDSGGEDDRVKSSLLCSFNPLRFSRRQKKTRSKTDRSLVSSNGSTVPSISTSFRNFFRKQSKKKPIQSGNFLLDQHDLPSTSTPVVPKRSFFRRDKSKKNTDAANLSANSLNSYDCSRSDSARNTPIRANVGHPVTMNRV